MTSLLLQIVILKAIILWWYLSGFSPPLKFFPCSQFHFPVFFMASIMNLRSLLDQGNLPLSNPFLYICFSSASTQLKSHSVIDGREFLTRAIPSVFPPQNVLRDLVVLFWCYLFIRPFCYVLSVSIFYSKIVLLPLLPVVGTFPFILHLHVGRILFRYFGRSYFVSIAWPCLGISLVFR